MKCLAKLKVPLYLKTRSLKVFKAWFCFPDFYICIQGVPIPLNRLFKVKFNIYILAYLFNIDRIW